MTEPNMSPSAFERWTNSTAFSEYRADRGAQTVDAVVRRTRRVLRGEATDADVEKLRNFISRHKAQNAGERKYGSPPVSAQTAALRNWGYDPTGKYS